MENRDANNLVRPSPRKIDQYCKPGCACCFKRYTHVILMMFGFILSFAIRINVHAAIVSVLSNDSNNTDKIAKIRWSPESHGNVDPYFFWGYVLTQIPGGFLAASVPANRLFGIAIFISSCLNLLHPLAQRLSPLAVFSVRVLQGLSEGVTFPACHGVLRWWASSPDRSILISIAYCGTFLGPTLERPLSTVLFEEIGWEAPFYFYGCVGILWYLLWLWLAFEKPSLHPFLSAEEQIHIEESLVISSSNSSTTKFCKDLLKVSLYDETRYVPTSVLSPKLVKT